MDWTNFILVNIVLALVIGVLGNIATGWVKSAYERSVFSSKKKRIERLIKDFKEVEGYRNESSKFMVFSVRRLATMVFGGSAMAFMVGILVVGTQSWGGGPYPPNFLKTFFWFGSTMLWMALALMINLAVSFIRLSENVQYPEKFDKYKERTVKKLKKLGANPEDLDKEEG